MEVVLSSLVGLWTSLGLPIVEAEPEAGSNERACVLDLEDRIALKDLSQPYTEGRYYPANGCVTDPEPTS